MDDTLDKPKSEKVVVGSQDNFWVWSDNSIWDLTHPPDPDSEPVQNRLLLACEVSDVVIDPAKTALVIVDMQNYTMHEQIRGNTPSAFYQAEDKLLEHGIPAARRAEIQIIWLNWGLTDEDLKAMPPGALRVFGWETSHHAVDYGISARWAANKAGKDADKCKECRLDVGLGMKLGEIVLEDGTKIDAGRTLMRDTWNQRLHAPLLSAFNNGQESPRPDVLIHKNRNSGLCGQQPDFEEYLNNNGIRTLLFTGANTDQCVMATLQDAFLKGFDTILLKDGCATDSPEYSQQSVEFNCSRCWGFLSTCEALAAAVSSLEGKKTI